MEELREVGGTQGSLTWTADTYSLNGRGWLTRGQRSLGILSFGTAKNQTLKGSHIVSVVDPGQTWGRLMLALETEHLGTFPHSFQVRRTVRTLCNLMKNTDCIAPSQVTLI